jgi:flagellar motor switch protein FliM
MANVLSQEEIDALLGGLSGGQIETSPEEMRAADAEKVAVFDFADQDRLLRSRLPTLETIHDRFARQLRLSLSTSLRRAVDIQICNQTLCSFGDFSRSLEKPSSLHLVKFDPLKGNGLLVLPGRLILTLVDLLFGGSGKNVKVSEERDFTMIEWRVIHKVAEDICRCYTESWAAVFPINVQQLGTETNVQFINIAQANDPVNVVDCDVMIEESRTSLSICIPYSTIEPIKDILRGQFMGENTEVDETSSHRLRASMLEAGVELRAMLGTAMITGRDLLNLHPGDILQLNEDYEHPVEVLVEGIRKFWGVIGTHKSGRALQITGVEPPKRKQP